jgi:hypothetical protein
MGAPNPVATVNANLKALGKNSRLRRGRGYYYFDGDALAWPSSSVYVYRSDALSVAEWMDQFFAFERAATRPSSRLGESTSWLD